MNIAGIGKCIAGAGAVLIAVSVEMGEYKEICFTFGALFGAIGSYIALHYVKKLNGAGK